MMLDERWSEDVEIIADTLRRMLAVESTSERVRAAEASEDGTDPQLEQELASFGLIDLEADAELFARIAFELGRALATTNFVETIAVQALLGRPGVALAFDGPVPASIASVASLRGEELIITPLSGARRRSAAGDWLVTAETGGNADAEIVGDRQLADRLWRYQSLAEAARLAGAAQALLAYGASYASEREQFGRIIGTYQGVAHSLSRAAGEADAAELLVKKAAFSASDAAGGNGAPSLPFAIMARTKAIEASRFVATNVHQVFGGNGFAMEYDVQLYSRRIRNWAGRGGRPSTLMVELGRLVLDPKKRDAIKGLWHYETGLELPRWAREADGTG